jgi:hypothetical protein
MFSHREKKIRESLELMFSGMDDDILKTVLLCTSLGKSEEEKDAICADIKRKQEEDNQFYTQKFEIEITKENSEEVLKLINPECLLNEKSTDSITETIKEEEDGNN